MCVQSWDTDGHTVTKTTEKYELTLTKIPKTYPDPRIDGMKGSE